MANNQKSSYMYSSILFIFGLILFLEWLYPLDTFDGVQYLSVFIIYTIYCFLLSFLQFKWWLIVPLKAGGLLMVIHAIHSEALLAQSYGVINEVSFFQAFFREIVVNIQAILNQEWYGLSDTFQTFLFLLIIWFMSYLVHYWFFIMKRFFMFVCLTFIYVAVLDTFTMYDATYAIIRVFVVALLALALANIAREMKRENLIPQWIRRTPAWILPMIIAVALTSLVGYVAPKYDPQWPDPVPFITSMASDVTSGERFGSKTVRKVGYGEDDSQLGGSFAQDDTVVFHAFTNEKQYWRIEMKDTYTGKGWIDTSGFEKKFMASRLMPIGTFFPDVPSEFNIAKIEFKEQLPKLVYPYDAVEFGFMENARMLIDYGVESVEFYEADEDVNEYLVSYRAPTFNAEQLQNADFQNVDEMDLNTMNDLKRYTQLPEDLPQRVYELAEDITAGYDTQFEKAKAIENYFGSNGFVYQTSNIPVPKDHEDYVDQFLFESQVGYCDNFSTSMVVMLRTLDIPARWVKGFTGGEKIEENVTMNNELVDVYEVTNANAHSWVEVFFPNIGWVPFEPTQGFDIPIDDPDHVIDSDESIVDNDLDEDIEENDEEITPDIEEENEEQEIDAEEVGATPEAVNDDEDTSPRNMLWIIVGAIIFLLLIMSIILYRQRDKIKTAFIKKQLKDKEDYESFEMAYTHLLTVLSRFGYTKQKDQTLREYAKQIDTRLNSREMSELTAYYEQMVYNQHHIQPHHKHVMHTWQTFINKILNQR